MKRLHIIGRHNSGKTTLILRLIPALKKRGLRIGVLKNAPSIQSFEGESDSARLAKSGADFAALAGNRGGAIFIPELTEINQWEKAIESLCPQVDLLLVEGYKSALGTKIEVCHEGLSEPPVSKSEEPPLFFVSEMSLIAGVQSLSPDDVDSIVDRIYRWWKS
ncbi:molybdopterin-guanine dinucleotide biosynthesis protein B [bacterium]|nr:molybdopterin-guanine dinucleotide biosynthesis protein B [bacterium]